MKKELSTLLFLFVILTSIYLLFASTIEGINDIRDHATFAIMISEGEMTMPGNFMLYTLIMAGSLFSTNLKVVYSVLCMFLAFASCLRYYWSFIQIKKINLYKNDTIKNYWISVVLATSLLFIFSIPLASYYNISKFYFTNFPPNVWHNSTIIFVFPFSLLLFQYTYKQLIEYSQKRDLVILGLILLNVLIKPSFFFSFILAYPLLMLIKHRFSKTFWQSLLPLIAGVLVLGIITWAIYNPDNESKSGIEICFMCVYKIKATIQQLPFLILFSMLFPILYSIFNYKTLKKNIAFTYTMTLLISSFAIYFIFAETGERFPHANFHWQIIIVTWLFFFITFKALVVDIKNNGLILKNKLLLSVYSLHVLAGLVYVFYRVLIYQNPL